MAEDIYVDVTPIFALPRTTGIQRLVRDVLTSSNDFRFLYFSAQVGGYVQVAKLPELVPRDKPGIAGKVRKFFRTLLLNLWQQLETRIRLTAFATLFQHLEDLAKWFYRTALSEFVFREIDPQSLSGPKMSEPPRSVWLLDIPKTAQHRDFLRNSINRGNFKLHVYLYDLIPITDTNLIAGISGSRVREEYEQYLSIVTKAKTVFCLSKFTRNRYEDFLSGKGKNPKQEVRVVYPPLDLRRLESLASEMPGDGDENHGLDGLSRSPSIRLLSIAPLNPRKNLLVTMRAFEVLIKNGVDAEYQIVAPTLASADQETITLARKLRAVHPTQFRINSSVTDEQLANYYRRATHVLVPSVIEGYGLPIVEGIFFGCHVIASRASSFIELKDRLPVHLVNPYKPEEWAEKCSELASKEPGKADFSEVLTTPTQFRSLMKDRN